MTTAPLFDRPCRSIKERFTAMKWGGGSLICLFISILSGIVVSLQYNPAEPYHSTSSIELAAPYGSFWRGLHYYSSQAFVLLLFCHFAAVVWENTHYYSRSTWIRLTLSLPAAILLLFTGYILRDDVTGDAAGIIGENIMLSIPLFGEMINNLLLAVSENGVKRVYANHLAGLMIVGTYCIWPHLRRYQARWRDHLTVISVVLLLSVFITAPMDPPRFGLLHIAGPWFFLGLQEILRYIHPFWAGVFFPGIFMGALLILPHKGSGRRIFLTGIAIWLLIYGVLSAVSFSRI